MYRHRLRASGKVKNMEKRQQIIDAWYELKQSRTDETYDDVTDKMEALHLELFNLDKTLGIDPEQCDFDLF